jgi:hypothetical protein
MGRTFGLFRLGIDAAKLAELRLPCQHCRALLRGNVKLRKFSESNVEDYRE